jgi:hypothetical protein
MIVEDFLSEHKDKIYDYPALPTFNNDWESATWIHHESQAPWLEIKGFNPPYKEMLAEAQSLKDLFVDHRDGENNYGWASLCVHGLSAYKTNDALEYGFSDSMTAPYIWTEIKEQCPITVEFFRDHFNYNNYQRLRFMLLRPGGYIMPHSDTSRSRLNTAINISLNNPKDCVLTTTLGTVPFKNTGSIFMFNNHYTHVAYNPSNEDRFHIIVHGKPNAIWNSLVTESYPRSSN